MSLVDDWLSWEGVGAPGEQVETRQCWLCRVTAGYKWVEQWSSGTLDHWNRPSVSAAQVWRLCVSWTEVMVDFWSDVPTALSLVCLFFGSVDAYTEIHECKMWIFCCWRRSENSNNNSLRLFFVMKLKYSWSLGLETGWFAVRQVKIKPPSTSTTSWTCSFVAIQCDCGRSQSRWMTFHSSTQTNFF